MAGEKKKNNVERMKEVLAKRPKGKPKEKPEPPATAAKTTVEPTNVPAKAEPLAAVAKSLNPRSAKSRDARMKKRGRLPEETVINLDYVGGMWHGNMVVSRTLDRGGHYAWDFKHKADGLFRLLEEMDIMFWDFYSKVSDDPKIEAMKKEWTFHPEDNKPEPMPPELKAQKASEA